MGIFANQLYAVISEKFYDMHHQEHSQIVHNSIIWVHNLTNEPCTQNPCEVCLELMELGWDMNEPQSAYNLHENHPMYKEAS